MAVEFKANIEEDYAGGWFIRLTDTLSDESVMCQDLSAFGDKMEELGAKYSGDIQVNWSKNSDVTPEHFNEVYQAMEIIKAQMDKNNG